MRIDMLARERKVSSSAWPNVGDLGHVSIPHSSLTDMV